MAALVARLERVHEEKDGRPVLEDGVLAELSQLTDQLGDDDDPQAHLVAGWVRFYRFAALSGSGSRAERAAELDAARAMFGPCFLAGAGGTAEAFPEPLRPLLADDAVSAAAERLVDAIHSSDPALSVAAVDVWQRIVDATPADQADRPVRLNCLGIALRTRFERLGELADLEAGVAAGQAATGSVREDDLNHAACLTSLGLTLQARFERLGELADLDASVAAQRAAVESAGPDHPGRAVFLANLGSVRHAKFQETGNVTDLEAALTALREAAQALPTDDPERSSVLTTMGITLWSRFERFGDPADLDEAVDAERAAVAGAPAGHPNEALFLSNLGLVLKEKFELTGEPGYLEDAIERFRAAVATAPRGDASRSLYLVNLSDALRVRHGRRGELADLDGAIEAARAATETASTQSARAKGLINLGTALSDRYLRTGTLADLDASADAYRSAIRANPPDHPEQAKYLGNLTATLRSRFERTGALADLDDAIDAGSAAVEATPAGHVERPRYLSNLSNVLQMRFHRTRTLSDLDAAIEAGREAVSASPAGHPDKARFLSNLCGQLQIRFGKTGALPDLDAAIEAGQEGVRATPPDHPSRPMRLSNCSGALRERFGLTGEIADLDAAIEYGSQALGGLPDDRPIKVVILLMLGINLTVRADMTGVPADRDAAVSAFTAAAGLRTAAPSQRITAARAAATLLAPADPGRSADLLESAVGLLVEVSPRQLARGDQQHELGDLAGLASQAAAMALADQRDDTTSQQRAARALRLLKAGRAVLISQLLDTRDDLTDLRAEHPGLAARFTELRDRLDAPEDAAAQDAAPGRVAEERRELADQVAATLTAIRALDGYSSFGLPPAAGELLAQAISGPVVTFNVTSYRSDALVLTASGIITVGLPGLTADGLADQISTFYGALYESADASASPADRRAAQQTMAATLGWLWDVAAEPVLDALGYRQSPRPGASWPRVWWAPGGLLGLLPVHAAGHGPGGPAVMDRVISSYTSTVRALRYARQHARDVSGTGRSLIVAMPVTPGLPRGGALPNVTAELALVRDLVPDPVIFAEPAAGVAVTGSAGLPTRAGVFEQLPGCSIAHFACHGGTDPDDPSKSLLLLHDHETAPLTVSSLANIQHDRLKLVYLSACRTAFTEATELLDEAINLASAFQLAGARHVVGTLWEIDDATALDVAAAFYRELRDGPGALDTERAAVALHESVCAVRDANPHAPARWAGYIHIGA